MGSLCKSWSYLWETTSALGASYEYADHGSMDTRINDGDGYYDDWYENIESSSSDDAANDNTKKVLKGVSTLKLGLEYKPMPEFAIRLGYNMFPDV